jgi:hypothetical protein
MHDVIEPDQRHRDHKQRRPVEPLDDRFVNDDPEPGQSQNPRPRELERRATATAPAPRRLIPRGHAFRRLSTHDADQREQREQPDLDDEEPRLRVCHD